MDAAFAATFVGWGIAGLWRGRVLSPVGLSLVSLNLVVGLSFLRRRPARRQATPKEAALCLPSVLTGPLAMAIAPPAETWPLPLQIGFAAVTGLLLVALLSLGRSFAVLPSLREVVARGPYRLVRHPIYACELLMMLAACLAAASVWGAVVFSVALVTLVVRVRVEESVLENEDAYRDYRAAVRYRLIPGIW